jgi:NhaP-type Na+/H+ or K+/H+ antiporter
VTVFTKRNALLGFLTLEMLKRRSRARQLRRKAPRLALFSLGGLVALGAVIGIVAVILRRRGEDEGAESAERTADVEAGSAELASE